MKLTSPSQVRELLETIGVKPSSSLGQCFLIDGNIRDIIVAASGVTASDVVLEVGPGLGVLTEVLAQRAARVIAVEKDERLAGYLRQRFREMASVRVVHADVLDLDAASLMADGVTRVVSNLPYSAGSRILMELFSLSAPPLTITVTVQCEVAERLAAAPGGRDRGLLSVWAQRAYTVGIRKEISPMCFCPRPKVRSAVVHMTRRDSCGSALSDVASFRELTRAAFAFRRKQMGTILARISGAVGLRSDMALTVLSELGIDARIRPESLHVDDWLRLSDRLAECRRFSREAVS